MKPRFEVTVYPSKDAAQKTAKSAILYGFSSFDEVASLYPKRNFSILNIDTQEYRTYFDAKPVAVFF